MEPVIENHIEKTPGVCGGKARVAGHRIRVQDIAIEHETWGQSPDEIAANHRGLTLADVYAALAYYHDHRDAIQREIEEDRAFAEQFRKDHPDSVLTLAGDGEED